MRRDGVGRREVHPGAGVHDAPDGGLCARPGRGPDPALPLQCTSAFSAIKNAPISATADPRSSEAGRLAPETRAPTKP
jgi:hypothetical protein